MKKIMITALTVWSALTYGATLNGTTWVTLDDKTGKPRAEIQIDEKADKLVGRIVKVYPEKDDTGICQKCPEPFKDKPILGLEFMWGLKQVNPKTWDEGFILDPKSGHIYHAKLLMQGDKLYVRGYIGLSLLGRTQTWERKKS